MKRIITSIISFFILLFLIIWFYTVSPWERAFTVTLWKIWDVVYKDGLHFANPFTTKAVIFDIQTQKLDATADASSKDLQTVTSHVALNYSIEESKIIDLYKTIWTKSDIESRIINPTLQEVIKAATAKFTAEWLISQREAVWHDIITNLKSKLTEKGIIVQAFNIINFQFSAQFNAAIESKVTAEQEALAQKNKLEQVKYEAQQQIEKSKAEAEKIKIQAQAIQANWWEEYVRLQWIAKWNWALPQYILWENTNLYMPIK